LADEAMLVDVMSWLTVCTTVPVLALKLVSSP